MTPAYEHPSAVLTMTEKALDRPARCYTGPTLGETYKCDCCGKYHSECDLEEKLLCPAGVEKLAFADITEIRLKTMIADVHDIRGQLNIFTSEAIDKDMDAVDILIWINRITQAASQAIGRAEYVPQEAKVPA